MSTKIQNFYEATITRNWTSITGDFNVSVAPSISEGIIVISPSSKTLREIVRFTATGTNAYGPYVRISNIAHRGLGGTTAQSHTIGEKIRMNITAEHWTEMQDDITAIIAGDFIPVGNNKQVVASNGTDWVASDIMDVINESVIKTSTITVTSDQIKAMYATPVEIIPSPGAGKIIVIDQIVSKFNYGTVAYTNGNNVSIRSTDNIGNNFVIMPVASVRGVVNAYYVTPYMSDSAYVPGLNTGIEIYNNTSAFTTGDGTLTLQIRYRILTL